MKRRQEQLEKQNPSEDLSELPEVARLLSGVRVKVARTNIQPPDSRIIGRDREVEALESLLTKDRVVTVLGAPGVGKSRLAREFAVRALDDYSREGGAWLVDMTEETSLDGLCGAVARALQVQVTSGGSDGVAQLGSAIAARGRVLLVLDNIEHALDPVSRALDEWLRIARDARWLVTSQVRLGVAAEILFELGPLSLPAPQSSNAPSSSDARIEDSDAVRFFIERARSAQFNYVPTREDAVAIAKLVRELDGNALAIELAAARIRVMTPAQMLAHLAQRFELLSSSPRRTSARHATLRAAIDSSWNMLDAAEKEALAQISVFCGGFDAQAAASVLDLSGHANAPSLMRVVEGLRDRSLINAQPSAVAGELRFSTSLSVREYAWERLSEMGSRAKTIGRHARYYVELGRYWFSRLDGPEATDARNRLTQEIENLVVTHRRALEGVPGEEDAAIALEAALALDPLLAATGPNTRRLALLDDALNTAKKVGVEMSLCARGFEARAEAQRILGRTAQALADYHEALALAEKSGARATVGRIMCGLGILSLWQGRPSEARSHFERAMTIHREVGDTLFEGRALGWVGNVDLYEGKLEVAWGVIEQAIEIHRKVGDRRFEGLNVGNLAVIAHDGGRLEEAKVLYERALTMHREVGDRRLEAEVIGLIAVLAHEEGRLDQARELYLRALQMHSEVGNRRAEGTLLGYLAGFLVEVGETEDARANYSRALSILRECGDLPTEGLVLGGLAALDASQGCIESARAALQRATECLKGKNGASAMTEKRLLAAVEIHRGHLELALAKQASRGGDRARAQMYLDAVEQRIAGAYGGSDGVPGRTGLANRSADVRLAIRSLSRALESFEHPAPVLSEPPPSDRTVLEFPADALVVCAKGRWFRAPSGETVSISRWKSLQNLVEKLAERREIAPGEALSVEELVAIGWPGERVLPKAGATRVYTALSTLRRLGLRDMLLRREGGYLLTPGVPIVRVSPRR